jgi:DNA primase
MGSDVERVKERLDIAEVVSGYVKLDRAGASFKGRCPFHNEKTPSFFVSPARQSYYCFGCGAKGDAFTFIQELEGLSFREALKSLAERAGVELTNKPENIQARDEKEIILQAVEVATQFFENELKKSEIARSYLTSRGISEASVKKWRLGYAPAEWRALMSYMRERGFKKEVLIKAGLIKAVQDQSGKEPYDVFRDRLIFPLFDSQGEVIAFSGRALKAETEPKYLNSPDTVLFTKSEVLYGLNKAKEKIRKVDYSVLVEGQVDMVLSHQAGVENTVASSGTAFTQSHLERLKRLSKRFILAFDGDEAGLKAAEKSTALALSLGLEVKVARMPEGRDPADLVRESPDKLAQVLRDAKPAIEVFLHEIVKEKSKVRIGRLIEAKLLPLIALIPSRIDQEHFVSLISQYSDKSFSALSEMLSRIKVSEARKLLTEEAEVGNGKEEKKLSRREIVEERLTEVRTWIAELKDDQQDLTNLKSEEKELMNYLSQETLKEELGELSVSLAVAESSKDDKRVEELSQEIQKVLKNIRALEE